MALSFENLLHTWEEIALQIGLSSFQMFVVIGMIVAGMTAKWQFQHDHHHDHHDD